MVTRHQFLTMLHDLLKPTVYLEIGVQYGLSLNLAVHSEWAIGVDPNPQCQAIGNQSIYRMTADQYFQFPQDNAPDRVDMAFIDGSHLWEDALQDFINIVALCGPKSLIVFDDVLPYNQDIAGREPLPGDWTGDVWKVAPILANYAENVRLVNTFPTGTMVVFGEVDQVGLKADFFDLASYWHEITEVPDHVLSREHASDPQIIIEHIQEALCESQ
jgi:hypothetical protein